MPESIREGITTNEANYSSERERARQTDGDRERERDGQIERVA